MNLDLDNELRELLSDRVHEAPGGAGLLDGVRVRSHQLALRRRYGLVLLAGLVVLALLVPAGLLRRDAPLPPVQRTASPSTSPSAGPRGVPVTLVPGSPTLPDFPFALGWQPAGTHFTVGLAGTARRLTDESRGLVVSVDTVPYLWDWEAEKTVPATVGGRTGTLRSATVDGAVWWGLSWQLADGRYVTVDSWGGKTPQADVLRLARAIKAGVVRATPVPFTLAVTPAGFVLSSVNRDGLCLAPPSWRVNNQAAIGLCVWLYPANSDAAQQPGSGPPKTLGGYPGQWERSATAVQFWSRLPDGRLLMLLTTQDVLATDEGTALPWLDIRDEDLDRFVAGLTPTS